MVEQLDPKDQPERWAAWGDALDLAITRFRKRGFVVSPGSRLQQAVNLLRGIAEGRRLPRNPDIDRQVVNAMRTALDFVDIEQFLSLNVAREIQQQLTLAFGGSLTQDEDDQQPYQHQVSLWVGTILQRGDLKPRVPSFPRRALTPPSPDYLVDAGTAAYGVEVKRPRSWVSLERDRLPGAARQLAAAEVHGAIVIDLSDILRAESYDAIGAALERGAMRLFDLLWDQAAGCHRPGYERVITAAVFCRSAFEVNGDGSELRLQNKIGSAVTPSSPNGLLQHRAFWIRDGIETGMRSAGFVRG